MTTPPTAADMDTWLQGENIMSPGDTRYWAGYTQNDSTANYLELETDPTTGSAYTQLQLAGLIANYGEVLVREYHYPVPTRPTTTDMAADSTEQARINDPANWAAAP